MTHRSRIITATDSYEFLYNRVEMAEALPRSGPVVSIGVSCSNVNSLMIDFAGESALCCDDFFAANGHGA